MTGFRDCIVRSRLILVVILLVSISCWAKRVMRDQLGREVMLPELPHRLVCLAPSITDAVYSLGAGDDVVGVTDYSKYPSEAAQKPSVGALVTPSVEAIVALHPDLVLAVGDFNPTEIGTKLEHMSVPVFFVTPRGIAGIYSSIGILGKVLHREQAADALVARLRVREQAIRARVSGKPVSRVFFPVWVDPVITVGKNAFITDLISAAGARSITDDLSPDWPQISLETVVARQPESLLLIRGSQITIADLRKKTIWKDLKCVQQSRVFYVDERIYSPSPVAFDALEELANQLHPVGER